MARDLLFPGALSLVFIVCLFHIGAGWASIPWGLTFGFGCGIVKNLVDMMRS